MQDAGWERKDTTTDETTTLQTTQYNHLNDTISRRATRHTAQISTSESRTMAHPPQHDRSTVRGQPAYGLCVSEWLCWELADFLESDVDCVFTEASTADHQTVLADEAVSVIAHAASTTQ